VVLERMEGTVELGDVAVLGEELARLTQILQGCRGVTRPAGVDSSPVTAEPAPVEAGTSATSADLVFEANLATALRARDPAAALESLAAEAGYPDDLAEALTHVRPDGVRMAALLVARLRFERLVQGSPDGSAVFERQPERFTELFRLYHEELPQAGLDPAAEWECFSRWQLEGGAARALE
jgi:hypothetical protein